jgi:hypothetical protein
VSYSILTPFWIKGFDPSGPIGYGVTAFSIADAFEIVSRAGYRLPDDKSTLNIAKDVKPADLHHHVRDNMGPIVVRGLWYPFIGIEAGTSN